MPFGCTSNISSDLLIVGHKSIGVPSADSSVHPVTLAKAHGPRSKESQAYMASGAKLRQNLPDRAWEASIPVPTFFGPSFVAAFQDADRLLGLRACHSAGGYATAIA
jgi:hypothetical protein